MQAIAAICYLREAAKLMSVDEQYRAAFEWLKSNKPARLPKGVPVSQNNAAKEAGSYSSALKEARYPLLIAEIQLYVEVPAEQRPHVSALSQLISPQKESWASRAGRGNYAAVGPPWQSAK